MDTLDAYRAKLRGFVEQAPRLLDRHAETAEDARLAREQAAALGVPKSFRLAVTGKIKQGKSTLINALIGRSLPTVGVIETTATLNFVGYGTGEDTQRIRVRWRDDAKPDEDCPLEFLKRFQGEDGKALAKQVACVFLFSDAPFLRSVELLDTPGEMGTQLAEIDVKTDALIRVLPYVAEENDLNRLEGYGQETRPFGSAAYNTIAVLQMWEGCWPNSYPGVDETDPFALDPLEKALERAKEQQDVLGSNVSAVLPVSGLLPLFSENASESCLNEVLEVCRSASSDDIRDLVKDVRYFLDDDYSSVSVELRTRLYQRLKGDLGYQSAGAWPALKMAIWATHCYSLTSAQDLRERLREMSNLDYLTSMLRKRFFALSELIHTGAQLNTALEVCDTALNRLRYKRDKDENSVQRAKECLQTLESMVTDNAAAKDKVRAYVEDMASANAKEAGRIENTCLELSSLVTDIRVGFDTMQMDLAYLRDLEGKGDEEHWNELRHLFGQYGTEMHQRLGCEPENPIDVMKARAWDLHKRWRLDSRGLPADMQAAIVNRLDRILDTLDEIEDVSEHFSGSA